MKPGQIFASARAMSMNAFLDEALTMINGWCEAGEAKSVALIGNAAEIFPELVRRGVKARHRY